MVANFFTKPLQGILYFTHRNAVLGINEKDMLLFLRGIRTPPPIYDEYCQAIAHDLTTGVCFNMTIGHYYVYIGDRFATYV